MTDVLARDSHTDQIIKDWRDALARWERLERDRRASRPQSNRTVIIGAGWTGAVIARQLHDHGISVAVVERAVNVGGHSRVESINGVIYEPNGPHIFHTSNAGVIDYVRRFGISRPFEFSVISEVYLDPDDDEPRHLSWPPQIGELRDLPIWPQIEQELSSLPSEPTGSNFRDWVTSLMGERLYRIFVEGYTRKQWGREPADLSASIAPRRVDLRDDGNRRLFRDRWEFFPRDGVNSIIESILSPVPVTCGAEINVDNVEELLNPGDRLVLTCPLDDFVGDPGHLEWRGIRSLSRYYPTDEPHDTLTAAYVINHPSERTPYTRTVETKHATGQAINGTVISEEHPGASARHYPVATPDRRNERANSELQRTIREALPENPVIFCGRLADYTYINQDEAIAAALATADSILQEPNP